MTSIFDCSPVEIVLLRRRSMVQKFGPIPVLRPANIGRSVVECRSPFKSTPARRLNGRALLARTTGGRPEQPHDDDGAFNRSQQTQFVPAATRIRAIWASSSSVY